MRDSSRSISINFGVAALALALWSCDSRSDGEYANGVETHARDMPGGFSEPGAPPPAPRVPCAVTGTRETEADCAEFATGLEGLKAGVDAFQPDQTMIRDESKEVRYSLVALPENVQGANGELAVPLPEPSPTETSSEAGEASADAGTAADSADPPNAKSTVPTRAEIEAAVAEGEGDVSRNVVAEDEAADVETGRIKVGKNMFACLRGDRIFQIEPENCMTYNTVEVPNPTWVWQVTPRAGDRAYKLFLTSGIQLEGADGRPRRIGQFSKTEEIRVEISTLGRFKDGMDRLEAWIRTPMGAIGALTALLLALGGVFAAFRKARRGEGGTPAAS